MSLETLEIPQPQDSEIPAPSSYPSEYSRATESNEAVLVPARNIWAEEIDAFAKAADMNVPIELEGAAADNTQESQPIEENGRVKDVFKQIRDLPYWAGAQLMSYTMVGKGSNRDKRKESLDQRKKLISAGVGALALTNVTWNIYKSAKGLHANFQSEVLTDILLPDVPESSEKSKSRINPGEVFDSAIDYSYQSVESTANTLINNFPKRRKTTKQKESKAPAATE